MCVISKDMLTEFLWTGINLVFKHEEKKVIEEGHIFDVIKAQLLSIQYHILRKR